MAALNPGHVVWCRRTVDAIADGGVWGVPRSGLLFQKTGDDELTLTDRMPWTVEMEGTITEAQLDEQQQSDVDATVEHMLAAGITVIDATRQEV